VEGERGERCMGFSWPSDGGCTTLAGCLLLFPCGDFPSAFGVGGLGAFFMGGLVGGESGGGVGLREGSGMWMRVAGIVLF